MPVISYDPPERFVAGAVGRPGDRAFYLQARSGRRVTSVGLEKFQVTLLAERLEELLDEVLRRSGGEAAVPAVAPSELQDDGPLDQPVEEEFKVGTMALAWDPEDEQVVIEAQEVTESEAEPDVGEDDPAIAVLRVRISPAQARAFAERALKVVAAGRPPCPLCGLPLDTEGHVCPRQNGYLG
ncbi:MULTISPECIES: DUF3090 domain-containing protein [Actinomadura]|uniref:DUF3090 domain-containing protein n=1 Tax=Actinomadura TaxID=1988 RepID=UPI002026241F|nr:DUF3090 domain-containing protein [Actinomadura madurae]MCP9947850.1 DUF3090 domain-containing protein [Actinomadura madurae]MCP9964619.1 DUF3090 domain-containing protein [Actinomadura madurae]MCP9977093.1 DUF3090 domain-containing protein [Actinomadura madurae]MCQ0011395.1 DUF3090 domain-containing protein [Actinomadura madurae]MCQ0013290.1 DUF3090 domain-containing protein [Actinomadura madurae]